MDEEIGIIEMEKNLDNLKKESELYPPKHQRLVSMREQLSERMQIHNDMLPLILEGIELVEPKFEFEKNPKFWELKRQLQLLDHKANSQKMRDELDSLDNEIKLIEDEIERIESEIPRIEQQLKDLKGE